MYCDYIFIKARRALRELRHREMWEDLKKAGAKLSAKFPKGPECEASEELDYPVYFVDYMGCISEPNPQPLTNPDQLIGWECK